MEVALEVMYKLTEFEKNKSMKGRRIFNNAQIIDVINKTIYLGWFSIVEGCFEFVEQGTLPKKISGDVVDVDKKYAVPGLIDAHMHIESSQATPRSFAEAVIPWGTCAVLQDPHEMANVFGVDGVVFMIENARTQPLRIYTAIPSCVPPTRKGLETTNASISAHDIEYLSTLEGVIALGEVMDYNGVLEGNEDLLAIMAAARGAGLSLEGHCPTLRDLNLSKYVSYGIRSDHTMTNPEKILEQLRKGFYVMIQAKSITEENISFIMKMKDRSRLLLVTDDVPAINLLKGHLNRIVALTISAGWESVDAIASATIRPAEYLGIRDMGSISPGKTASFFIAEDLESLKPDSVFIKGKPFSLGMLGRTEKKKKFLNSLHIRNLTESDFCMVSDKASVRLKANVINVNRENSITELIQEEVEFMDGFPIIDNSDLVQIAVFCRNSKEPTGSIGFLKGLGLRQGAFATSFAHDTHNLLILGKESKSMTSAANAVIKAGGGMAVADRFSVSILKLPIGGLITDSSIEKVAAEQRDMVERLKTFGLNHRNPLILLTVLALSVSPYYKISDFGLVDTENSKIIPVFP
ncbi:MAG: adenine deaminase [Candidatus Aminicenantes bacterium]|nr:MAG: adenine deaminase [Candidatus Aminicenantes bacterium]